MRLDPLGEEIRKFKANIEVIEKGEWLETSEEVIKFFNPKGLGGAKFFIYAGVKVCPFGKKDEIEEEMDAKFGQAAFGKAPAQPKPA